MSKLAVTALADRPRPRGGPSAVMCSTPPVTNIISGTTLKLASGPSTPQGRTVRRSTLKTNRDQNVSGIFLKKAGGPSAPQERTVRLSDHLPNQRKHPLWYKFELKGRTVRTPWADRLPFIFQPTPETTSSLVHFSNVLRTVRTP